jgi:hypothetical protein
MATPTEQGSNWTRGHRDARAMTIAGLDRDAASVPQIATNGSGEFERGACRAGFPAARAIRDSGAVAGNAPRRTKAGRTSPTRLILDAAASGCVSSQTDSCFLSVHALGERAEGDRGHHAIACGTD